MSKQDFNFTFNSEEKVISAVVRSIDDTGIIAAAVAINKEVVVNVVDEAIEVPLQFYDTQKVYVPFLYSGLKEDLPNTILKIDALTISIGSIKKISEVKNESLESVVQTVIETLYRELTTRIREPHLAVLA